MNRKPRSRVVVVLVALAIATFLVPTAWADEPSVSAAPGGMPNFTVAVGRVDDSVRTNWQRLATYRFDEDGTVSEQHWHWTQRKRVVRESTGIKAEGCPPRECEIRTAAGFSSASAPLTMEGVYTVVDDVLRVEWSDGGQWEEWSISSVADGKLAKLEFVDSNFGATHGFAYGSTAESTARASMTDVAAADHSEFSHEYHLWKTDDDGEPYVDSGSGSPFWIRDWDVCDDGRCLGAESATPTEYYVSPPNPSASDRRDTLWHWVRALADGRGEYCYTGNSHVKPMLQIIDGDGNFHGWVGVEASINESVPDQGTSADDVGVFRIARF